MKRCALVMAAATSTQVLTGCVVAGGYSSSGDASGFFVLLPLLFLIFAVFSLVRVGRRRARPRRSDDSGVTSSAPHLAMLRAELSVLADDVLRLEPQVALHPAARDDFDAATYRARVAQAALEQTQRPQDLQRVQRVVDEGVWAMSRARAIIEGRPPPAPPQPLQRPGPGGEPALGLDGDAPTYVGSPMSFRTGWFGGGLLGGMLLGPLMGGFGGFGGWIDDDVDGRLEGGPDGDAFGDTGGDMGGDGLG